MSSTNAFLKEFMSLRKSLVPSGTGAGVSLIDPTPKKKGRKHATTAPELAAEDGKMTIAKIVEEKPKFRDVCEFIQNRCNELTLIKMA
jgi:hypothetical protein